MIPTNPSEADPSILSLMQGVVGAEGTGGNADAQGDKNAQGQYTAAGIGMWSNEDAQGVPQALQSGQIPANFQGDAKALGLNPDDFSIGNQNKVLYGILAKDKAAGLSPSQALSKWNSGDPNAYQTSPVEKSSVSASGTSNVAAYVQKGLAAAQKYAQSQGQNGQTNGQQQDAAAGAGNVSLAGQSPPPSGGIPITPLGGTQSPQQSGGIPITPLQVPQQFGSGQGAAGTGTSYPTSPMQSPFPLENIASGNSQANIQRGIGAAKGLLQVASEIGGTSGGNPVVNAMLNNAPAFKQDIQAANNAAQPTNQSQKQGATETQLGAGLLAGTGVANLGSDAFSSGVPAIKGMISAGEDYVKANPVKSAIGAYVIANLLKNTGVGNAIEKATGIKGLLDLI